MRVTFPRLPDHEKAYAVIEQDDGVVLYWLYVGAAGTALPHDVRQLVVERALGIRDGLWGEIASGKRRFRATGLRTEVIALLAEQVAGLSAPTPAQIRRLASTVLSVLPDGGADVDVDVDVDAIAAAARALQVEASRWARLRPGEQLVYDWPAPPGIPRQRPAS